MFQDFYTQSDHLIWPLVGLLICVTMFIGVLAFVCFGLRDKDKLDAIAALPLDADTTVDGQVEGRAGQ